LGRLGLAALFLTGRLALTGLWLFVCAALAIAAGLLLCIGPAFSTEWSLLHSVMTQVLFGVGLAVELGVFAVLYRRVILGAVRMALVEFAWFDRLADDEFEPRLKGRQPWLIPLDPSARR
jgi:hypothetical protein